MGTNERQRQRRYSVDFGLRCVRDGAEAIGRHVVTELPRRSSGPGTLRIHAPGTYHSVVSEAGCIVLAVYEKPVKFLENTGTREVE